MFTGNEPSNEEVVQLIDDIEKYTLANHLFWGLWGIISVCISSISYGKKYFLFSKDWF